MIRRCLHENKPAAGGDAKQTEFKESTEKETTPEQISPGIPDTQDAPCEATTSLPDDQEKKTCCPIATAASAAPALAVAVDNSPEQDVLQSDEKVSASATSPNDDVRTSAESTQLARLEKEFNSIVCVHGSLRGLTWDDFRGMKPDDAAMFKKICDGLLFGPRLALMRIHRDATKSAE